MMKSQNSTWLRAIRLLVLFALVVPAYAAEALPMATTLPPEDMFQLPWDQGLSWVAIDGLDNGFKRPLSSSHNFSVGGAIDFAPHNNMRKGENTSNFWVAAAAAGTVIEKNFCYVKVDHGNGWVSTYQFLANIQVKVGNTVSRNQRLGIIANGVSQPFCPGSEEINVPHVHFMLRPTLRDVTFAGWKVNYLTILNRTTFTKNGQTVGLFQPLLNAFDTTQIVLRGPITWDTTYTGSIDTFRYERWSLTLTEQHKFKLAVTPTTNGLTPLILLLDANGNELARGSDTLTSTQPAGNYFVQIQPQLGNGFYSLLLQKDDEPVPPGPYVSTVVSPASFKVGETAAATVSLNNVPAEGYTSAEFTCTYDASRVEVSNISVASLFGNDSVVAINGPQNGTFIVAVAGSNGNKATTSGTVFTFSLMGLNDGQSAVECKARVSQGTNTLTELPFIGANLVVLGTNTTPTPTPVVSPAPSSTPVSPGATPTFSPSPAAMTPTSPTDNWLTFINSTYNFLFKYPPDAQILNGRTDTFARINLPFQPGTNLHEKYLEVAVAQDANPCRSPVAASSIVDSSQTVTIDGLSFLKEVGGDAGAGNLHQFVAYSTLKDNTCVSLSFVLHSLNPDNSATPPPVFDYPAESAIFEQIVSTYEWLTSGTATPIVTATSSTPVETVTPTPPTPVESPTPTVLPNGSLTGQVLAGKPVTVSLYTGTALVTAVTANPDGTFNLAAPAGSYTVIATASGFLSAQGSVTISGPATKPTVTLLAGDIDGNNVIDPFDALTIGMNYNASTPSAADLNNDGVINVLDLEVLAHNYRASGPLPWG